MLPIANVTTAALFGSQREIGVACLLRVRLTAGRKKKKKTFGSCRGCGDDYQMLFRQYLRNAMRPGNAKQTVGPLSWNRSPVRGDGQWEGL